MPQAQDYPAGYREVVQRAIALLGRVGAERIYKVPPLDSGTLAGGASVDAPLIQWRKPGWVIGMLGQVDNPTAANMANMHAKIQFGSTEDLIITGIGGGTDAPFFALFGTVMIWYPLMRRVTARETLTVTYRNSTAATPLTPTVLFALIEDPNAPC